MAYMRTVGHVHAKILAAPMTWAYAKGELRELAEVRSLHELANEWNDVVLCSLLAAYAQGWVPAWLPILPFLGLASAKKYERRLAFWPQIFFRHGLHFDRKYLARGGNYGRKAKVQAVLAWAAEDQSKAITVDWAWLEQHVTFE